MMKTLIQKTAFTLLSLLAAIHYAAAQIPQNIDVATEGETEPLENAPSYMVLIIILLLIAFVFYIFFYRRRR